MSLLGVTERLAGLAKQAPPPAIKQVNVYDQLREALLIADQTGAFIVQTPEAVRLLGNVRSMNDLSILSDNGVITRRLENTLRYIEYSTSRVEVGGVFSTYVLLKDCTAEYLREAESRSRNALYAVVSRFATSMLRQETVVTLREMIREAAAVVGAVDVAVLELGINESYEYAAHPVGMFGRLDRHLLVDALSPALFRTLHKGKIAVAFVSDCRDPQAKRVALGANVKTSLYVPVMVHDHPALAIVFHFAQEYTGDWFYSICDPLNTLASLYAADKLRVADAQDFRLLMSVSVADSMPLPVCYLNDDGLIVHSNAYFAELNVTQQVVDQAKLPGANVSLVTLPTPRGSVDLTIAAVANEPYPYIGVASSNGVPLSKTFMFMRDALDSMRYPVITTDRAGDIVYANSAAETLLGSPGTSWPVSSAIERLRDHLLICAKGKSKVCYPDVFGDRAYNVTLVRLADSDFRGVAACFQPADSNDYYRMLATDVPVGILSLDGAGSITFMNNAAQELLHGLLLDNIADVVRKGYVPYLRSWLLQVKNGDRLPPAMYRLANGKYVEVQGVRSNSSSDVETIHVVMRSINSVELAEAPLRTALDAIPYPAIVFDSDGQLVFANQQATLSVTGGKTSGVPLADIQKLVRPSTYSEVHDAVTFSGSERVLGEHFSMDVSVFGDISVGLMLGVVK